MHFIIHFFPDYDPVILPNQIHRPSHPLHHFSGDYPVREIAILTDLQSPQHGNINVTASNHRERLG
jgi:hypothetical protein